MHAVIVNVVEIIINTHSLHRAFVGSVKSSTRRHINRAIYWYIDHKLLQKSGKDNYHKVGCVEKPQPVLASEENDDDFPF